MAQSAVKAVEPEAAPCAHTWEHFLLPGEPKGRVLQCTTCKVVGYRKSRHGGGGRIELYKCSHPRCKGDAVRRMTGRGPRGAYIWACTEHNLLIQGQERAS